MADHSILVIRFDTTVRVVVFGKDDVVEDAKCVRDIIEVNLPSSINIARDAAKKINWHIGFLGDDHVFDDSHTSVDFGRAKKFVARLQKVIEQTPIRNNL